MNKIYWGTLSGTANLGTHDCVGLDQGHRGCKYDIAVNNSIDVDDLLAVIDAWGNCTPDTLCTNPQVTDYQCPEDVAPFYNGNGVVNVDDLPMVINNWGPCSATTHDAPESVDDCESTCATRFPGGGTQYSECVERCLISLCERGIPSPQDCP